jgi:excisionase family DNA binding protein
MLHTIVCTDSGPIVRGMRPCAGVPHRPPGRLYIGMTTTPTTTPPQHDQERPPTRPLLVNVMQAAEILSLSRSTIYQLIWSDQLTPIRIGRSIRFPVEQLERFVADRIAESMKENNTA